jgi:signal peptidase II
MITVLASLSSCLIVILIDQSSKALAIRWLKEGEFLTILGPLGLRLLKSVRGGYVTLPDAWFLAAWGGALGCLWLLASVPISLLGAVGIGMLLGGASGNVLDRFLRGAVVDFIALRGWRTFNLADLLMVVAAPLVWSGLF